MGYAVDLSDQDIDNLTTFLYEVKENSATQSYDNSFETHRDGGS